MNKIKSLLFSLVILAFSCKKNDPAPVPTNADLISKTWKLTAATLNGTDAFALLPDCIKDNLFIYTKSGNFTEDEGLTKCNVSDPQIIGTAKWSFPSSSTLNLLYPDGTAQTFTIIQLTTSILKFSYVDASDPTLPVTVITTFG